MRKRSPEGPGSCTLPGFPNPRTPLKLSAYVAAFFQALIAAGTFLVAKDATERFTPLQVSWFRIVLSGLLMSLAYALFRGDRRLPGSRDWPVFVLLGLSGVTFNQMLFIAGIHQSTPLHASLLYAFTPVLVLFGAILHLGERLTRFKAIGVLLAVGGVILVLTERGLDLSEGLFRGDLIILGAVFAWAIYTLIGKRVLGRYDTFTVITLAFGFGTLSVLPALPWVLRGFDPRGPGWIGWVELLYLSAITSGVAFTLWYFALRRLEATQVAVFTNLQAPLTALLAWLVFGTLPGPRVIAGGLLVLAGVTAVQLRSSRKRVAP